MTRPPINRDLFGAAPPTPRDERPVRLPMVLMHQTQEGWFLSPDGKSGRAKWAPKSKVSRGVGADATLFTMPRWIARERGWL